MNTFACLLSPGEDDVLGRQPGEALWPERIPLSELNDRKNSMTTSAFVSQFQMAARIGNLWQIYKAEWFPRYAACLFRSAPI